jgi:hypothetical protein
VFEWHSDGTIISTDRTRTKIPITFLESREFEALFDTLSNKIGMSTDPFLIEAQKNIGKILLANLPLKYVKRIPANRFLRPQLLARIMVFLIAQDIAALGDGRINLERYRAGEVLALRFRNPCVNPLLIGSSAGIYESIEDMPGSNIEYGQEDGDLVITLTHTDSAPEGNHEARLYLEEVIPGRGPITYERCLSCGAPLEAARSLSWDLKNGIITNKLTGEREVVVSVQSVNAILRELESELGEDVLTLIYDAQKAIEARHFAGMNIGERDGFWREQLEGYAIRGLGYPLVFEATDSSLKVEIGNAYNQVLYAAKLAAALEALTGELSTIEWKFRSNRHGSYEISVGAGRATQLVESSGRTKS